MTTEQKQQFEHWLINNLQLTSKSNVELIIKHVEHYFTQPTPEGISPEQVLKKHWDAMIAAGGDEWIDWNSENNTEVKNMTYAAMEEYGNRKWNDGYAAAILKEIKDEESAATEEGKEIAFAIWLGRLEYSCDGTTWEVYSPRKYAGEYSAIELYTLFLKSLNDKK